MCGIFGIAVNENGSIDRSSANKILDDLFILSESRGKEASGLAYKDSEQITYLKSSLPANEFIRSKKYREMINGFSDHESGSYSFLGHSRLVTNGKASLNINNQPVEVNGIVAVHNGIITNDKEIFSKYDFSSISELDTISILRLIDKYEYENGDLLISIPAAYQEIEGTASLAVCTDKEDFLYLSTNNGSIYYYFSETLGLFVYASESFILRTVLEKNNIYFDQKELIHLNAGYICKVDMPNHGLTKVSFDETSGYANSNNNPSNYRAVKSRIVDLSDSDFPDFYEIKRCTKCILPYTFPYIEFDNEGVCNYCHNHEYQGHRDHEKIKDLIAPYKKNNGEADCIVGLSGGRDSCYGVHYVKEVLGMNPVAFTYDWGMVTDLARRNIFRICGKLGIEHILVSADIHKKRDNVKRNIEAWLKKPSLMMIPLFMAGDKQFYLHAHKLRKQVGVDFFMFCAGNTLEITDFKVGFAGIQNNSKDGVLTQLSKIDKLKLATKYGLEFASNPSYLNRSLFDTLEAFYSSYVLKDDYLYLYHHIPWIEDEVNDVLKNQYSWEGSSDTTTTWRVGDGTAAFYNYIYYVVAGFTEHDTFRSNQIREGMISRKEALEYVSKENQPRWETLEWYAKVIGFNIDHALQVIHKMPKLYGR